MRIIYYFITLNLLFGLILNAQIEFKKNDQGFMLYDSIPRYFYQVAEKSLNGKYRRADYVHPLFAVNGDTLTEDFPDDHPHHRGIFWSWHRLYIGNNKVADPWMCEGISWKNDTVITKIMGDKAKLESHTDWIIINDTSKYNNLVVLKEEVIITYLKKNNDYYELDFKITFNSQVDSLFIGGSEDEKGYGGFSVRLKTPADLKFTSENGNVIPRKTPIKTGNWIDVSGISNHGIMIVANPAELPDFQGWILRSRNSMQNAAFPGNHLLMIPKNKPLTIHNKLVIYIKPVPE